MSPAQQHVFVIFGYILLQFTVQHEEGSHTCSGRFPEHPQDAVPCHSVAQLTWMMEPVARSVRGFLGSCSSDAPSLSKARWLSPSLQHSKRPACNAGPTLQDTMSSMTACSTSGGLATRRSTCSLACGLACTSLCTVAHRFSKLATWPALSIPDNKQCGPACQGGDPLHLRKVIPSVVSISGLSGLCSKASM